LSYAEGKRMGLQAFERLLAEFDRECPALATSDWQTSNWLKMRRRMIAERFGLESGPSCPCFARPTWLVAW
jgi:hypothetical protein